MSEECGMGEGRGQGKWDSGNKEHKESYKKCEWGHVTLICRVQREHFLMVEALHHWFFYCFHTLIYHSSFFNITILIIKY